MTESVSLPTVRLKIVRRSSHPWIFQKMVEKPAERLPPGSVVDILDRDGQWVGRGFYNGHSRIALRVLTADAERGDRRRFLRPPHRPGHRAAPRLAEAGRRHRRLSPGPFRGGRAERPGRRSLRLDDGAGVFRGRHVPLPRGDPGGPGDGTFPDSRFYWFAEEHVQKQESFDCRLAGAAAAGGHHRARRAFPRRARQQAQDRLLPRSARQPQDAWPRSVRASACSICAATPAASRSTPRRWARRRRWSASIWTSRRIALAKQNAEPEPGASPLRAGRPVRLAARHVSPPGSASTWWFSIPPSRRATARRSTTP